MKNTGLTLAFALLLSPALAQQPAPPPQDDGFSLMQEGVKLLFRGLMEEVEPQLDEMGRALSELEPALRQLPPMMRDMIALIDDLRNYHAPEKLPNGDILLRRKQPDDLDPTSPPAPEYEL